MEQRFPIFLDDLQTSHNWICIARCLDTITIIPLGLEKHLVDWKQKSTNLKITLRQEDDY